LTPFPWEIRARIRGSDVLVLAADHQLSKSAGVRSGVMYPILQRMLDEGWLSDGWEEQAQAGRAKRPPRRYYELTDTGKSVLGAILAQARRDARFNPAATLRVAGVTY
jgi:DNA-binding PadR family transcriptional regulator